MRPSVVGTVVAAVVCALLSIAGSRALGPLPPLGAFFDPVRGVVGAVRTADLPDSAGAQIPGVTAPVEVVYDDRGVPHIFAANTLDAYRALGYVVARDRLFQIEVQARAGGGTLHELIGERGVPIDQATHRLGMPHSAEQRLAQYDMQSRGGAIISAYAEGVNAYVEALSPRDYPFEYKLLSRAPKRWEPVDLFHLLNRMGETLASSQDELTQLRIRSVLGQDVADALFPIHAPIVEPIQPNGQQSARFEPTRLPPPGLPDTAAKRLLSVLGETGRAGAISDRGGISIASRISRSDDAIGSNNWAVSPKRAAAAHALLAGDPHLELTLPSIWYEAHIVVRDSLDVYGVTIPGAPGIVIGFNRAVSWTFTNTGADVADFFVETVRPEQSPTEYLLDGTWEPLQQRIVEYRTGGKTPTAVDTLRFNHRGPLQRMGNTWISRRWTVLEASSDFEAFDHAARSSSARELLDAMAATYGAPAQNMLVADTAGHIAIRSTGHYPLRPGNGRGDVLRDGSTRANDWSGMWPVQDYPQGFDPAQGFLASANQEPLDPRVQARYMGANWERPWRAMRINTLLRRDSAVTPDAMRRYQSDPGSARADLFVPAFLQAARSVAPSQKLSRAASLLAEWNREYTPDNRRTVLFESAMTILQQRLWDELSVDTATPLPRPNDMITAVLLRDSTSVWWDDRNTSMVETRDELLAQVLEAALDTVTSRHGEPDGDGWAWQRSRVANIYHLLQLPALSRLRVPVQGGPATLWPSSGNGRHGPSWRMVAEMSAQPRAWGIYPGGQSGNPLSRRYDDRIDRWSRGELDTLRVPRSAEELSAAQRMSRLTITARTGAAR